MHRRQFLAGLAATAAAAQAQQTRPNFIVIYTDDQGIGDLGCYFGRDMKTPHIDALAAGGIRFTDWHTNSPVCSPSRAAVLTGKYPQNAGVPHILTSKPDFNIPGLRKGENTIASELKKLGYRTAAVGKWHLGSAKGSRPMDQGFDEWFGFYSGWTDYYSHRYYTLGGTPLFHDMWRGEKEVFEEPVYQTELLGREAKAFLNRQNDGQPFFLYLAFGAPHYPMMAPRKYLDRFPAEMDRDRREHVAMVAAIDDQIGELMATLKARGFDRNTVIFYQADNGATREERADHLARSYRGGSNGPYRAYKGSLFEGGTRVPGLLRWPAKIKPNQVLGGVGMAMDILPTFVRWAGGTPPAGIDGTDLTPMVLEGKPSVHDAVFWDYDTMRAVRRGPWKLLRNYREGLGTPMVKELWLSNLDEDPGENKNFAASQPVLVKELTALMDAWKPEQ
ncbi:MAG: sulfatase-like hydrolase/transferase [Bryobacterales bacterium]|nr:sulfatase-like hydrolase/transferase [Bryobacterales bacterium]